MDTPEAVPPPPDPFEELVHATTAALPGDDDTFALPLAALDGPDGPDLTLLASALSPEEIAGVTVERIRAGLRFVALGGDPRFLQLGIAATAAGVRATPATPIERDTARTEGGRAEAGAMRELERVRRALSGASRATWRRALSRPLQLFPARLARAQVLEGTLASAPWTTASARAALSVRRGLRLDLALAIACAGWLAELRLAGDLAAVRAVAALPVEPSARPPERSLVAAGRVDRSAPFRLVGLASMGAGPSEIRLADLESPYVFAAVSLPGAVARPIEGSAPLSILVEAPDLSVGLARAVPPAVPPWVALVAKTASADVGLYPWGLDLACLCDPADELRWRAGGAS